MTHSCVWHTLLPTGMMNLGCALLPFPFIVRWLKLHVQPQGHQNISSEMFQFVDIPLFCDLLRSAFPSRRALILRTGPQLFEVSPGS